MPTLLKSALLGAGLVAGAMTVAHAQSNVAALPPSAPMAATAPSYGAYPGPQPGGSWGGVGQQTQAVTPSPSSLGGPNPGAGSGIMPPKFEKSADYDQNTALHPYTSSMGPRPN